MSVPPWQSAEEWNQVELFFERSKASARNRQELNSLAQTIASGITDLEGELDRLCAALCPACTDNCCRRATVWYDFRDLVFLSCLKKNLPSQQIVKTEGNGCPNLGTIGCTVPRLERPFVCTWYLCPAQTSAIRCRSGQLYSDTLTEALQDIQRRRKEIERRFLAGVV